MCDHFQRKVTKEEKPSIDEQLQMKKILKGINTDQQYQHNKLMDEFKKAHQKMFKGPGEAPQNEASLNTKQNNALGKDTLVSNQTHFELQFFSLFEQKVTLILQRIR